jgi:hypothetical protein
MDERTYEKNNFPPGVPVIMVPWWLSLKGFGSKRLVSQIL